MATIPIEVIVQDAEAPIVPSEDGINTNTTVPDTGTISNEKDSGGISSSVGIILPIVIAILAIVTVIVLMVRKHHNKHFSSIMNKKEKLATVVSSTIAILAVTVLVGNLVIPATSAATSDITDGITPSEDKVSIVVTRDGDSAEASIESTAAITSTSDFGYKVLLSMAEGVETSNLYLDGNEESEYYIASVEAENEEGVELADNTWGYALEEDGGYSAIPLLANAATVLQGDEPVEDEALNIYYGVKVSSALPAGTYSGGEIEYSLEAIEPSNINELTYMQDFATLSNENKALILNSMTEGEQYQLKDSRDQKEYFISKLADGNVWMTQNLDLNIEAGRTYTSADTDLANSTIGTSWTPTVSTSTTSSWTDSYTAPSSYDPGNLYWNGALVYNKETCENIGGTWQPWGRCENANHASSTGDSHYHLGNYYNWAAAIAMNNSSSYTTNQQDANQSICPAGWRLPIYDNNKSYQNLVSTQNLTAGLNGNIQNSPTYFIYIGYWYGFSNNMSYSGEYWSSVVESNRTAYRLNFYAEGKEIFPQTGDNRNNGCSIRCVIR